ncbi:MAG: cyclic nucleotide-binding domain-containing protein [Acidimicrobiales bacterium]|jgi:CRP-like cAMP-binding protein|nr:cyclic nucleotide-binding domain-containing protein [Acidimicrobiales bacterium]
MFGQKKKAGTTNDEVRAVAERLRGVSFFEGFTTEELVRVAGLAEEVDAQQGALLIDQGRVGRDCYVIVEGEASVYAGEDCIATLGPGSMVGEMSLIEHRPRNASVVADSEMRLIVFDTQGFKRLLDEMPKAHDRVMETLATRLKGRSS